MRRPVKRRPRRGHLHKDAGLTLLELAVAILVLAIGSIAATRATDQARVATAGIQDRTLAQIAARNRAEELQLSGLAGNLPAQVTLGGRLFDLTTAREVTAGGLVQVTVTARAPDGAGAQYVVYLLPGGGP